MTPKEAIEVLKKNKPTSDPRMCGKELCDACDVAIEALEKQIPKRPESHSAVAARKPIFDDYCPNCQHWLDEPYSVPFCPICGQAIDWGGEE